ncbi:hypothetical protein DFH09DRAFT_1091525 [Mycena vulgaris]|nr:hypothetical protein DFH09DRAFT_1091525 [Mycena vulgaris]
MDEWGLDPWDVATSIGGEVDPAGAGEQYLLPVCVGPTRTDGPSPPNQSCTGRRRPSSVVLPCLRRIRYIGDPPTRPGTHAIPLKSSQSAPEPTNVKRTSLPPANDTAREKVQNLRISRVSGLYCPDYPVRIPRDPASCQRFSLVKDARPVLSLPSASTSFSASAWTESRHGSQGQSCFIGTIQKFRHGAGSLPPSPSATEGVVVGEETYPIESKYSHPAKNNALTASGKDTVVASKEPVNSIPWKKGRILYIPVAKRDSMERMAPVPSTASQGRGDLQQRIPPGHRRAWTSRQRSRCILFYLIASEVISWKDTAAPRRRTRVSSLSRSLARRLRQDSMLRWLDAEVTKQVSPSPSPSAPEGRVSNSRPICHPRSSLLHLLRILNLCHDLITWDSWCGLRYRVLTGRGGPRAWVWLRAFSVTDSDEVDRELALSNVLDEGAWKALKTGSPLINKTRRVAGIPRDKPWQHNGENPALPSSGAGRSTVRARWNSADILRGHQTRSCDRMKSLIIGIHWAEELTRKGWKYICQSGRETGKDNALVVYARIGARNLLESYGFHLKRASRREQAALAKTSEKEIDAHTHPCASWDPMVSLKVEENGRKGILGRTDRRTFQRLRLAAVVVEIITPWSPEQRDACKTTHIWKDCQKQIESSVDVVQETGMEKAGRPRSARCTVDVSFSCAPAHVRVVWSRWAGQLGSVSDSEGGRENDEKDVPDWGKGKPINDSAPVIALSRYHFTYWTTVGTMVGLSLEFRSPWRFARTGTMGGIPSWNPGGSRVRTIGGRGMRLLCGMR